ncbi:hypothetical protein FQN57_004381 [Myotisia sp. PD_48]|nr:hypothetical protein FQN57_004381 [Myotisia sp. PD_48]
MQLLSLPAEILLLVMNCLGPSYFHADVQRLTISRQWHSFAIQIFHRDIYLSASNLERFLVSITRSASGNCFKEVTLKLHGFHDKESLYNGDSIENQLLIAKWTALLDHNLSKLAGYLRSTSVRALHLHAFSECCPYSIYYPRRDYLKINTLSYLLSLDTLTVLDLDTCGNSFLLNKKHHHICSSISRLLPQLHHLRLRLREICPVALSHPENNQPKYLKRVIINLSLSNENPEITAAAHAKLCDTPSGGFPRLESEIVKQAHLLATHLTDPGIVRVLWHSFPSLEMQSLDILTGKRMRLPPDMGDMGWEDDGETVPEDPGPESDFSDDSSDSDPWI